MKLEILWQGSARPGILGEATVNMATYMSSNATVLVSLHLKENNNEITLQVSVSFVWFNNSLFNFLFDAT